MDMCDRCGVVDDTVAWVDDCPECPPTALCSECYETHQCTLREQVNW